MKEEDFPKVKYKFVDLRIWMRNEFEELEGPAELKLAFALVDRKLDEMIKHNIDVDKELEKKG